MMNDTHTNDSDTKPPCLFRVRTITAFVSLRASDFPIQLHELDTANICHILSRASDMLHALQDELTTAGYEVQTLRVATNPFGEWLLPSSQEDDTDTLSDHHKATVQLRLACLHEILERHKITFCAVGPAYSVAHIRHVCPLIVASSPYISCSAHVAAGNVGAARAAATCILTIAALPDLDGLGNFRFCMSHIQPGIPFFPAATAPPTNGGNSGKVGFAVGLENGRLARALLQKAGSMAAISTVFRTEMARAVKPVQDICQQFATTAKCEFPYLGMDTSLNPSLLDDGGSVAEAIECLDEVDYFGAPGTTAAAAAITTALQSLPDIVLTGYCGLMLPVCEDQRLAALALATTSPSSRRLEISHLLAISSVCGVGVDTVPLAGTVSVERLTSLLLDVAGIAARWNKSLSCRVLPFAGKQVGDRTDFDSPFMVNTDVFDL